MKTSTFEHYQLTDRGLRALSKAVAHGMDALQIQKGVPEYKADNPYPFLQWVIKGASWSWAEDNPTNEDCVEISAFKALPLAFTFQYKNMVYMRSFDEILPISALIDFKKHQKETVTDEKRNEYTIS